MKIGFHIYPICNRGTTVASLDYAKYCKSILGIDSVILYNNNPITETTDPGITLQDNTLIDIIKQDYSMIGYNSFDELGTICESNNITHVYTLKSGANDGFIIPGVKNLVHAVFQTYDPHGDRYAYISDWLSKQIGAGKVDYVPHIVDLPRESISNFREKHNIPQNKIVIGRIGGFYQFDIQFAAQTVANFAYNNPNYVFVFVNTFKFVDLPNVLFLDSIFDEQEKTDFILSCNAMIHARSDGETFGLAICESLFHNIPVLCFNGGRDKHHIDLLHNTDLLYNDSNEFHKKLLDIKCLSFNYSSIVEQFSPENVMQKFNKVFLL